MVDHHDEIIAAFAGERIRWTAFCAEVTRLGLTDTGGRPPTERNARETWRQARRMVARAKLRQAAAAPLRGSGSSGTESSIQPLSSNPDRRGFQQID